jgi:glycerol-3-phosphate dehydrogenase (NAD(P)+)
MKQEKIYRDAEALFGGGTFALTLARTAALNNPEKLFHVLLRRPEYVEAARNQNFDHFFPRGQLAKILNPAGFGKTKIPKNVSFSTNEEFAGINPDTLKTLFSVYPAQNTREILGFLKKINREAIENTILISGSKGIEIATQNLMNEVLLEISNNRKKIAIAVGPNNAKDIWQNHHATITFAGDAEATSQAANLFRGSPILYPNESTEMYGLDVAGVAKNVHSLAAGISIGLDYSPSTISSLMQHCLKELRDLLKACDCKIIDDVLLGISGDYDLAFRGATRNAEAGINFAKKGKLLESQLTEGVKSLPILLKFAKEKGVAMPIIELIQAIFDKKIEARKAAAKLTELGSGVSTYLEEKSS